MRLPGCAGVGGRRCSQRHPARRVSRMRRGWGRACASGCPAGGDAPGPAGTGQAGSRGRSGAEQGLAGDRQQPPLVPRSGSWRRLKPGVRPCGRERNPKTKTRRPGHGLMTTAGQDKGHARQGTRKTRDTQDRERPRQRTRTTETPPRESRSTTKDGTADAPRRPPMRGPTRFPASRSWGRGRGPRRARAGRRAQAGA